MLYTNVLSPVFYYNVVARKRRTFAAGFFGILLFFDLVQLYNGVDVPSFIVSNGLFISTYFCVISFYYFVNDYDGIKKLYRDVLVFNAIMVVIAIPFFFMDRPAMDTFWYINKITRGYAEFPRLAMFTYEASYYSLLFLPVFYYYSLKFIFNDITSYRWLTFLLAAVPMLLSLSFGVLGTSFITIILMCFISARRLFRYKRAFISVFSAILLFFLTMLFLAVYFPGNILFARIENILTGVDTSANGRTVDSFTMAWRIADSKSLWFGAGLGQIKIITLEIVRRYYNYWGDFPRYDIPNAMGETLAIFGLAGVGIRLFLEWYLFFKTRVYSNYYRLSLFIFIFIYQFTGSFITNIVEYVIWILAFSGVFNQFSRAYLK